MLRIDKKDAQYRAFIKYAFNTCDYFSVVSGQLITIKSPAKKC